MLDIEHHFFIALTRIHMRPMQILLISCRDLVSLKFVLLVFFPSVTAIYASFGGYFVLPLMRFIVPYIDDSLGVIVPGVTSIWLPLLILMG